MSAEAGSAAALGSSLAWGSADYVAGVASRRVGAFRMVLWSQATSCLVLLMVAAVAGVNFALTPVLIGLAGGAAGGLGLVAFYRAMEIGAMSVAAPVSALGVLVPVGVSVVRGELPGWLGLFGIGLALSGIVMVSIEPTRERESDAMAHHRGLAGEGAIRSGVIESLLAAMGFGTFMTALDAAMNDPMASTLLVTVSARTGSSVLLVMVAIMTGAGFRPPGRLTVVAFCVGLVDFLANSLLAYASTLAGLAVVAVLGSLYPVVPMILARVLLGERLGLIQRLGSVLVLLGVLGIAGSGT